MGTTKYRLKKLFLSLKIVGVNPEGLTLKSGKNSYWYANCRALSQTVRTLEGSAKIVKDFILGELLGINPFDVVLGVPEGATLLGNEVQKQLIISGELEDHIFALRVKPKEHGDIKNKFWTNGNVPKRIILLEDVTTTGGSVLELAVKLQQEMNIEIVAIISLFNRQELDKNKKTVEEKMQEAGFDYYSILYAEDILQEVVDSLAPEEKMRAIELINNEFFDEYGELSPIVLK